MYAHDAVKAHLTKTERKGCPRPFGRKALAPLGGRETPPYLDRWQNLGEKVRDRESNRANEAARRLQLDRKEPEASVLPSPFER